MGFTNRLNLNRHECSVNLAITSLLLLLFFIPTVQPTVDLGLQGTKNA